MNVSVIIPAYNAARYLRVSIDSVLSQTHPASEIVVVDDGSTDETASILASYGARVRALHQPNQGSAAARNHGVAIAQCEWLAFLDADDVWLPRKLELQLPLCRDYVISHTDVYFGMDEGKPRPRTSDFSAPYRGRVLERMLVSNGLTSSAVLMRKDVFLRHRGFSGEYPSIEDWALWLRVTAEHEIGYVAEPLVEYRVAAGSLSSSARRTLPVHLRLINDTFGEGGLGSAYPWLRRQALAGSYQITGRWAAAAGDWRLAVRCAARGVQYRPGTASSWVLLAKAMLLPLGVKY